MLLFRFRVSWEDDDSIYRDILLQSGQTFDAFQKAVLNAFEFKKKGEVSFFESNEWWSNGREISSEILTNKKGAAVLSTHKTKVSALVNQPDKRFVFLFSTDKKWRFLISLIELTKEENDIQGYPIVIKSEGISPHKIVAHTIANDNIVDTDERFDLNNEDMEEQGFNREGE